MIFRVNFGLNPKVPDMILLGHKIDFFDRKLNLLENWMLWKKENAIRQSNKQKTALFELQ